jgi:hypothetical protein
VNFHVTIEIPKGGTQQVRTRPRDGPDQTGPTRFTATTYPADYWFIDNTLGQDGDPIDGIVLLGSPTFPGCLIRGYRSRVCGGYRAGYHAKINQVERQVVLRLHRRDAARSGSLRGGGCGLAFLTDTQTRTPTIFLKPDTLERLKASV